MLAHANPKIAMLDDDSALLEVAAFYLEKKFGSSAFISTFNNSSSFLRHIETHCYLPDSPQDIIRSFYTGNKSAAHIEQTLKDLSELPALLIVDHQLHESVTGIEICQKIRAYVPFSFIILLTSQVDNDGALALHNDDIIDVYIRKDETNAMNVIHYQLSKKISKLNSEYYINPEDAFGFETMLEDAEYLAKRDELLNEIEYKAYLTISKQGDLAILDINDTIKTYHFNHKAFSLNG